MHPSAVPSSGNSARFSDGSFSESEDIYMTIDTGHGAEFFGVEPPRAVLTKELSQNERQISVDPISLQGSTTIRQASFRLVSSPVGTTHKGLGNNLAVPSPPPKLKFVSASLPSSTSSSPQSTSLLNKIRKSKNDHQTSSQKSNLARVQSAMDDSHLALAETNQRRSRSLGEGRKSSIHTDDFDLWLEKSNKGGRKHPNDTRGFSKPPLGPSGADRVHHMKKSKSRDPNFPEDGFKCGKLCLFLPRGKGKPVRSISAASTQVSAKTDPPTISRTVSLERFECGSWASSLNEEEGESTNLFFDLPMELLRCSVSDMQSPVTAAFVFDNDDDVNGKDINIESEPIAIRREDINAFLEAQN